MGLALMPKYINAKTAAERAEFKDTSTIRRAIINGWLKAEKLGGHDWLIEEKNFQKWVDAGKRVYPKKS